MGVREQAANDRIIDEIIRRLAAAAGVDPLDLNPPLFEVVDPESLEQLIRYGDGCSIRFAYNDWIVEVGTEQKIRLEPRETGD